MGGGGVWGGRAWLQLPCACGCCTHVPPPCASSPIPTHTHTHTDLLLGRVYGEYRCGKTQLCHTLCVTSQMGDAKGRAGKVGGAGRQRVWAANWVQHPPGAPAHHPPPLTTTPPPHPPARSRCQVAFVDTENTFRPEKLRPIAERFGLAPDDVRAKGGGVVGWMGGWVGCQWAGGGRRHAAAREACVRVRARALPLPTIPHPPRSHTRTGAGQCGVGAGAHI